MPLRRFWAVGSGRRAHEGCCGGARRAGGECRGRTRNGPSAQRTVGGAVVVVVLGAAIGCRGSTAPSSGPHAAATRSSPAVSSPASAATTPVDRPASGRPAAASTPIAVVPRRSLPPLAERSMPPPSIVEHQPLRSGRALGDLRFAGSLVRALDGHDHVPQHLDGLNDGDQGSRGPGRRGSPVDADRCGHAPACASTGLRCSCRCADRNNQPVPPPARDEVTGWT
jgi:hypothetical protein